MNIHTSESRQEVLESKIKQDLDYLDLHIQLITEKLKLKGSIVIFRMNIPLENFETANFIQNGLYDDLLRSISYAASRLIDARYIAGSFVSVPYTITNL